MDGPPLSIGRRLRLEADDGWMTKMPITVLEIDLGKNSRSRSG
jgi:hypothetical protein